MVSISCAAHTRELGVIGWRMWLLTSPEGAEVDVGADVSEAWR